MSVLLSAKHKITVEITDTERRYLLTVPTYESRARFRSSLSAAGLVAHGHAEFAVQARETLLAVDPDFAVTLMPIIDQVEAEGPATLSADDAKTWGQVTSRLVRRDPAYAQMVADNAYYLEMAPVVAARVFLAGWENTGLPFKTDMDGLVSRELLEVITSEFQGDLYQIWSKVLEMLSPDQSAEKNSASPSPSSGNPEASASAASSTKPRSTARRGASSASDTTQTH